MSSNLETVQLLNSSLGYYTGVPAGRTQVASNADQNKAAKFAQLAKLNQVAFAKVQQVLGSSEGLDLSALNSSSGAKEFFEIFYQKISDFLSQKVKPVFSEVQGLPSDIIKSNQIAFGQGVSIVISFFNAIADLYEKQSGQVIMMDKWFDIATNLKPLIEATRSMHQNIIFSFSHFWEDFFAGIINTLRYDPEDQSEPLKYTEELARQVELAEEAGFPIRYQEGLSAGKVIKCPAANRPSDQESMIDLVYDWMIKQLQSHREDLGKAITLNLKSNKIPDSGLSESAGRVLVHPGTGSRVYCERNYGGAMLLALSPEITSEEIKDLASSLINKPTVPDTHYAFYGTDREINDLTSRDLASALLELANDEKLFNQVQRYDEFTGRTWIACLAQQEARIEGCQSNATMLRDYLRNLNAPKPLAQ